VEYRILPDRIVLVSGMPLPAAYVKTIRLAKKRKNSKRITHIIRDLALWLQKWIPVLQIGTRGTYAGFFARSKSSRIGEVEGK
jgi:hypothetical protein